MGRMSRADKRPEAEVSGVEPFYSAELDALANLVHTYPLLLRCIECVYI